MSLALSIVTPQRPVVETEVDSVLVPGAEGEFGVLPGHEPLLAPLGAGVVEYAASGRTERVAVSGGFAEVSEDRVTLLARTAERPEEIDRARAERAGSRAADALREAAPDTTTEDLARLEAAAARAAARLRTLG